MNPVSAEHLNLCGHSKAILDILLVLSVYLLALDFIVSTSPLSEIGDSFTAVSWTEKQSIMAHLL